MSNLEFDWSKEHSPIDLCGYCDGYITRCDGSCFKDSRFGVTNEQKSKYLIEQILQTEKRLAELKYELSKLQ